MPKRAKPKWSLSPLENELMQVVWQQGSVTADQIRQQLHSSRPLKESTVRTVLGRLEAKGVLKHTVDGRTYVYRSSIPPKEMASDSLRTIVDRFCAGSVSRLVLGMVESRMISPDELRSLANEIDQSEKDVKVPAPKRKSLRLSAK